MAKGLRGRVGKQDTGTQRTRKAVHGEGSVELAKWTFPIISFSREPYEAKVSRTGLTGGMGRRTVRQRALCLPSDNVLRPFLCRLREVNQPVLSAPGRFLTPARSCWPPSGRTPAPQHHDHQTGAM